MTVTVNLPLQKTELDQLKDLLHQTAGLLLSGEWDEKLATRVAERMARLGIHSFEEYYHLLYLSANKTEVFCFVEGLLSAENYFFKNRAQLRGFAELVLPAIITPRRELDEKKLRIWDAACAGGEEPYTLAMLLRESIEDIDTWQVTIVATDIDRSALQRAETGVYSEHSLSKLPEGYREKYFTETDGGWQIAEQIRKMVTFKQLNLVDRFALREQRLFDFVFCRGVLPYFSAPAQKKVVGGIYDALVPGGYLFLGESESIGHITAAFELDNIDGFLCYKKP